MRCLELMERAVHFCCTTDSVVRVAQYMRDYDIGMVPICDADGTVVGVLTDRDLTVRVVAEPASGCARSAGDVMSTHIVSCRPEDDIVIAERLMAQHQKGRILCTDAEGRLAGVISLTDIVCVESDDRAGRLFRSIAGREAMFLLV